MKLTICLALLLGACMVVCEAKTKQKLFKRGQFVLSGAFGTRKGPGPGGKGGKGGKGGSTPPSERENPCDNGGYYDEDSDVCYCNPPFDGERCEEVCSVAKCGEELHNGISDYFEGKYGDYDDRSVAVRSYKDLMNLKRQVDDKAEWQAACKPLATQFQNCVTQAFDDFSYCQCSEENYGWFVEVPEVDVGLVQNYICGEEKCDNEAARHCMLLYRDVNRFVYDDHEDSSCINHANIRDKIVEVRDCLTNLDTAEAAAAGCFVEHISHVNPDVETAIMEARLDKCPFEEVLMGCPHPDIWFDACAEDINDQITAFIDCIDGAIGTLPECATVQAVKVAAENHMIGEAANHCAAFQKFEAVRDACDSGATAADLKKGFNAQDVRSLLKLLKKGKF